jgi:CubicO group peptidase (beta-lactamase class C family)
MTAETPVRIASISKLALALALHRLADRGVLALDDDASHHLGWALRNPAHPDTPVTIRQLLRHESSLSDAGGYGGTLGQRLRDTLTPRSWSPAAPGTAFDYSNLNSAILAEIVEAKTGERFDRAMQALVFAPLGIRACFNWSSCPEGHAEAGAVLYRKSTDFGETWAPEGPWVAQVDYERPAGGCPVRRAEGAACDLAGYAPGTNGGLFGPQGGLRVSVAELARLGQALLVNEGRFLSPRARAELFRALPVKAGGDGAETDTRLMRFWSAGGLHCFSGDGQPGGDQPTAPAAMTGCGHLGEAYGLFSALVIDPRAGTVMAWAMTGSAEKPRPGAVSRFNASEEALAARARRLLIQHPR